MLGANRFRALFRRPAVTAAVVGVVLSAALLVGAGLLVRQAAALSDRLPVTNSAWIAPVPTDSPPLASARAAWLVSRPDAPPVTCRMFGAPDRDGIPARIPVARDGTLLKPESPALLCDGSPAVVVSSVPYERWAWERSGGLAAAFRPGPPACSLTPPPWGADSGPDSMGMLVCRDQQPVRVPPSGMPVVASLLYSDLSARTAALGWGQP